MKSSVRLAAIFENLKLRGLITPDDHDVLAGHLKRIALEQRDPHYIKILAGVGAWVSALFLGSFVGMFFGLSGGVGSLVAGLLFMAGGIGLSRAKDTLFFSQLSLALVLTGNGFVLTGSQLLIGRQSIFPTVLTQGLVCVVAYPLYANSIYRFIAPLAFVTLATSWIVVERISVALHVLIAAEAILAGFLLLRRQESPSIRPLAYSSAFMLPATLLFMNLTQVGEWGMKFREPLWPSSIVLTIGLIAVYIVLAGGRDKIRKLWMILAIILTAMLGVITTPGILVAIGLLLIGYSFGERALVGMSFLFLSAFLFLFYYAMNLDLMSKSWVIGGSGILLIIAYWIIGKLNIEEAT